MAPKLARVRPPRMRAFEVAAALSLAATVGGASAQTAPTPPTPPAVVQVTDIRVEGNTLLPETEVRAITARGTGATTMENLQAVAATLQAAYRREGFGGVVVIVPQQAVNSGTVVLRVVEGRIAKVRVTGQQQVSEANVRASLPALREGQTPRLGRMDREIQMSNESPTKELLVMLKAGAAPGEIDADVQVKDQPPVQYLGSYSNTGDAGTGRHRVAVGVRHANLFDRDHIGTLQVQTSPEHLSRVAVLSAGYRRPLYEQGISIDAFAAYSDVSLGNTTTPAGPLAFTGRGTIVGVRANRLLPRLGEFDQRITVGAESRHYRNECSLGTLGAAGCGPSGVSVRTLPLSLAWSMQAVTPEWSGGASASLIANAGGSNSATFEAARPGAPRHYRLLRLSAFGQAPLASGFQVAAHAEAQLAGDPLISPEKFGLGGVQSVRGYQERELTGDRGYLLRLEGTGPNFGPAVVQLRPVVFVDHGRVSHRDTTACRDTATSCSLSSVGVGLRIQAGPQVSGLLDVGRAANDAAQTRRGDWRVHAMVNVVY